MPPVVLDVGSGSGILALAALRLGAERAVCYDTDPLAVEATVANAGANDLADRVTAHLGSLPPEPAEPYPLVLREPRHGSSPSTWPGRLAAHTAPAGTLLASGIIETRADEVVRSLTAAGFVLDSRLDDGEWVSARTPPKRAAASALAGPSDRLKCGHPAGVISDHLSLCAAPIDWHYLRSVRWTVPPFFASWRAVRGPGQCRAPGEAGSPPAQTATRSRCSTAWGGEVRVPARRRRVFVVERGGAPAGSGHRTSSRSGRRS